MAKGIVLDVAYSYLAGLISEKDFDRVVRVFQKIGFELHFPVHTDENIQQLLKGIQEFREHLGGQLTITLISEIGKKHDVHEIDEPKMVKALHLVNQISESKAV